MPLSSSRGRTHLERAEAINILNELIRKDIVQPSFVNLSKNEHGSYDLIIKGDCDTSALRAFLAGKNLILNENTEKKTCRIYRP